MSLVKADLIQKVYSEHESLSKIQASEAVESLLRITKDTLSAGSDVLLTRFGKFRVDEKKERTGRNPQTGDPLILDARRIVTFHPSTFLRDKVNCK